MSAERLGPPQIEPLTDAAWSRIERGVWSRIDTAVRIPAAAPRRRWIGAAPLVLAAAVAIALIAVRAPRDAGIREPSRVVSGSSPSSISFGDIHVELDAETAVVMVDDGGQPVASVERGAAWFTVAPRGDRPAVLVRAGDATIRVIGTRFRVARAGERVAVAVEHGTVRVAFHGRSQQIVANQRWSSDAPDELAAPATTGSAAAAPPDATGTSDAPTTSDPADTHSAAVRDPPRRRAPGAPAAAPAPGPSVRPAPPTASDDVDRDEYDRLAALEAAAPGAALAGYLQLARSAGPWAGPALFAAGRLAADRGEPSAIELLDRYLRRFPAGANAADARALRQRLAARR